MTPSRAMVRDTLADDGDNDGEQIGSAPLGCFIQFSFFLSCVCCFDSPWSLASKAMTMMQSIMRLTINVTMGDQLLSGMIHNQLFSSIWFDLIS